VEHLPYVVIGDLSCPIPNVHKEHHGRFGVESSYRMIDKARARTTCRDPRYRLLLAGLALTFVSLLDHSEVAGVGSAQARGAVD
jgi:putative transposase